MGSITIFTVIWMLFALLVVHVLFWVHNRFQLINPQLKRFLLLGTILTAYSASSVAGTYIALLGG